MAKGRTEATCQIKLCACVECSFQCSGFTAIKILLKDKEVSFSITNQTINGVKRWPARRKITKRTISRGKGEPTERRKYLLTVHFTESCCPELEHFNNKHVIWLLEG